MLDGEPIFRLASFQSGSPLTIIFFPIPLWQTTIRSTTPLPKSKSGKT